MNADGEVFVLDSFAILAYLGGEAGMKRVKHLLQTAEGGACQLVLPLINLGEVVYITERKRGLPQAQAALAMLEQLPLEVLPASREAVLAAAHVKANHALSYADAFAVAAAQTLGGTVLTGDTEFHAVEALVPVEWLVDS
ncbi:MAG: type II toxin-antitoxin system VapC family toxin [Anaerolineales bacterium]